ncbi:MAG: signal peptidase II [Nitrospirota bacterium]
MSRKSKIILIIAGSIFCLDRLTKVLAVRQLQLWESVPVIKGYFDFTLVHNTGAAFGFMAVARQSLRLPFLLITAGAAVALLLYFIKRTDGHETLTLIALAMVVGGAAGNMADRIAYGYVIDFIDWHAGEFYHWPAFNIADSGITVGVFFLAYEFLVKKKSGCTA